MDHWIHRFTPVARTLAWGNNELSDRDVDFWVTILSARAAPCLLYLIRVKRIGAPKCRGKTTIKLLRPRTLKLSSLRCCFERVRWGCAWRENKYSKSVYRKKSRRVRIGFRRRQPLFFSKHSFIFKMLGGEGGGGGLRAIFFIIARLDIYNYIIIIAHLRARIYPSETVRRCETSSSSSWDITAASSTLKFIPNNCRSLYHLASMKTEEIARENSSWDQADESSGDVGGPSQTGFRPPSLFGTRVLARWITAILLFATIKRSGRAGGKERLLQRTRTVHTPPRDRRWYDFRVL